MTQPVGYMNLGWAFLRAAEFLHLARLRRDLELFFRQPELFLIGQSFELILKAYIWHVTGAEAKYSHNLVDLLREAESNGLNTALSGDERAHLCQLNASFGQRPYEAKYLQTGVGPDRDFQSWFLLCRKLMDRIEPCIAPNRAASIGLRARLEHPPNYPVPAKALTMEEAVAQLSADFLKELADEKQPAAV